MRASFNAGIDEIERLSGACKILSTKSDLSEEEVCALIGASLCLQSLLGCPKAQTPDDAKSFAVSLALCFRHVVGLSDFTDSVSEEVEIAGEK